MTCSQPQLSLIGRLGSRVLFVTISQTIFTSIYLLGEELDILGHVVQRTDVIALLDVVFE